MATLDDVTKDRMRRTLAAVHRHAHPVAAYLFGSRAEGRADAWSDYDVAVFIEGAENWDMARRADFFATIQGEAGDDIEVHVFPAYQAAEPEPASFASHIIKHGVALTPEELVA